MRRIRPPRPALDGTHLRSCPEIPSRPAWRRHVLLAALLVAWLAAPLPAVAAEDGASGPEEARDPIEEGRVHTVSSLRSKIRKIARGPWAERKRDEVLGYLTALEALGGWEAGRAALEAVWDTDTVIRDRAFGLAEREHHEKLLPTLDDLLEEKDLRRDADLRRRLAHAYAVIASPKSIEKLAELIRSDEPAEVVDEAARAAAPRAGASPGGPLRDHVHVHDLDSPRGPHPEAGHDQALGHLRQDAPCHAPGPHQPAAHAPARVAPLVEREQEGTPLGPRPVGEGANPVECLRDDRAGRSRRTRPSGRAASRKVRAP